MSSTSPAVTQVLVTKANPVTIDPAALSWGRSSVRRSWLRSTIAASPGLLAPLACVIIFITLEEFDGSLNRFFAQAISSEGEGFVHLMRRCGPQLTYKSSLAVISWVLFQAALYRFLPGPVHTGQRTPAGHLLAYRLNGLSAWIITHVGLATLCLADIVDPGFIPRNWGGLVVAMNVAGFLISAFAYFKAHLFPSHPEDCRFSGSAFYDFYMGIELNPRIGKYFDLKLFSNGRPGIIAWTLIDFSNIAYQHQTYGHIDLSLILITTLHVLYVVDFFVNESWYLRTIDIAHDHYGFYLAWGCFCYLPITYTIQAQYLGLYPQSPNVLQQLFFFAIGLAGYCIFRSANNQKDKVRRAGPGRECLVRGQPVEFIKAEYTTTDGKQHVSLLLCSHWWGWSRHTNYVGDLMISYSLCALVGTDKGLVWFYAVWMTMLLVHRCMRDEQRCQVKYGAAWTEYCRRVPWRFVPGVW